MFFTTTLIHCIRHYKVCHLQKHAEQRFNLTSCIAEVEEVGLASAAVPFSNVGQAVTLSVRWATEIINSTFHHTLACCEQQRGRYISQQSVLKITAWHSSSGFAYGCVLLRNSYMPGNTGFRISSLFLLQDRTYVIGTVQKLRYT